VLGVVGFAQVAPGPEEGLTPQPVGGDQDAYSVTWFSSGSLSWFSIPLP